MFTFWGEKTRGQIRPTGATLGSQESWLGNKVVPFRGEFLLSEIHFGHLLFGNGVS